MPSYDLPPVRRSDYFEVVAFVGALLAVALLFAFVPAYASSISAPPAPAAHGPLPSDRTVSPPSSIDATGVQDVTQPLNAFLSKLRDNTTVQFPAGAKYRSEGTLVVAGKHNLTIDGNGALLVAKTDGSKATPTPGRSYEWPRSRATFLVAGSSGVTIENLVVHGPNDPGGAYSYQPSLEAQHGVDVEGSSHVTVTNDDIAHVYGDFVYVSGRSTDVQVTDNTFNSNGRQGVSVTDGSNVLIQGNKLYHVARSAFDLEPNVATARAENIYIYDNLLAGTHLSFVAAQGMGAHVGHVYVVGNQVIDSPLDITVRASDGSRRSNWYIFNNKSDIVQGSPIAVMGFWNVSQIQIAGNHQAMVASRPSVAIYMDSPCQWAVWSNSFPGAEPVEPQGIQGSCPWVNSHG